MEGEGGEFMSNVYGEDEWIFLSIEFQKEFTRYLWA
jgi:hypothetical protein